MCMAHTHTYMNYTHIHIWITHTYIYELHTQTYMNYMHIFRLLYISHGTHEWVMAHTNESWHTSISRSKSMCVSCVENMNEPWRIWMSYGVYKCVMAHMNLLFKVYACLSRWKYDTNNIWHGYVTAHMNESWHTRMSHGTYKSPTSLYTRLARSKYKNENLWHAWVMAHTNESWHTRMSHGTYESLPRELCVCHVLRMWQRWRLICIFLGTHEWVMAHINVSWRTRQSHMYFHPEAYVCVSMCRVLRKCQKKNRHFFWHILNTRHK